MMHRKFTLTFLLFLISIIGYSVTYNLNTILKWNKIQLINDGSITLERLSFESASYHQIAGLPFFIDKIPIHTSNARLEVRIINQVFIPVSVSEYRILTKMGLIDTIINVNAKIVTSRKEPMVKVELMPIRWNEINQTFEKLISFDVYVDVIDVAETTRESKFYTNSSVLATGNWFKIKLNQSGIYKVTYNELSDMGFNMSTPPSQIAVFGNGGGLLPEKNDEFRYDDLFENPILLVGGEDGSFDQGDYIIFYGEGPVVWKYNGVSQNFHHQTNYYKDYSYYFITAVNYAAKRIQDLSPPAGQPDVVIEDFTDYGVHHLNERNLAGIGRTWYGEIYDYNLDYEFVFDFPNIKMKESLGYLKAEFASRAFSPNAFKIFINNTLEETLNIQPLTPGNRYEFAKGATTDFQFSPTNDQLVVKTVYQRSDGSSVGYLDYVEVNVQRELIFTGDQMMFRKVMSESNEIAKFNLLNSGQNVTVWDISTPVNPQKVVTNVSGNSSSFKADATTLHDYIAFTANNYLTVEFVEQTPNQNLHSYRNIDYVILTHPDFIAEAEALADFHRTKGTLEVLVVTTDQVYNEFSSGGQDITAIRDFAKMLYDDSDPGKELKYLLLFGDASYDYKDVLPDNTNFVPCWESVRSLDIVWSIASDDYFGFLDDGEGVESSDDLVDIGIGRFVVASVEEAQAANNKTFHYSVNSSQTMGPWRNVVTFIADD